MQGWCAYAAMQQPRERVPSSTRFALQGSPSEDEDSQPQGDQEEGAGKAGKHACPFHVGRAACGMPPFPTPACPPASSSHLLDEAGNQLGRKLLRGKHVVIRGRQAGLGALSVAGSHQARIAERRREDGTAKWPPERRAWRATPRAGLSTCTQKHREG